MVYKNKGKFVLDREHLQSVVDEVLKRNADVSITIKKSPVKKSNSFYLYIYIDEHTTCLRVSDHGCKSEVRQIIVCESTGAANVCYKIERAIKDLRYKKLQSIIAGVGNGYKESKGDRTSE